MNKKILLFSYKYKDEYHPEHIIQDLESEFDRLEYGDVLEGEFQVWEYPSGKIYKIEPDRKVPDDKYYSSRSSSLWSPKLTEIEVDKRKVSEAYEQLSNLSNKS